jgi:hypothetical protein
MRLSSLHEAYWQPISNHPGQLGKLDKRAKKNDKSFLVHPEDRKRWLKWFSGGKKIKESLDDKDEFTEMPSQEQLQQAIRELRAQNRHGGMPGRRHILDVMERMYVRLFGEPYNPTPDAPRM